MFLHVIRGQERFIFLGWVGLKNILMLIALAAFLALCATTLIAYLWPSDLFLAHGQVMEVMNQTLQSKKFWDRFDFYMIGMDQALFKTYVSEWRTYGIVYTVCYPVVMGLLLLVFKLRGEALEAQKHVKGAKLNDYKAYVKAYIRDSKLEQFERLQSLKPDAEDLMEIWETRDPELLKQAAKNYISSFRRYNPLLIRKLTNEEIGKPFIVDITGKIKLFEDALSRGCLFVGKPGTGKSATLKKYMKRARRAGEKCVIVDIGGELSSEFGREDDVYLGLTDPRDAGWSWSNEVDANGIPLRPDRFAEFSIPEKTTGEDIWWKGPRLLLKDFLTTHDFETLWEKLLTFSPTPEGTFQRYLKKLGKIALGTEGSGQEAGIMASLAEDMEYLEIMNSHALDRDGDKLKKFQMYKYIHDNDDKRWVWITYEDKDKNLCSPYNRLLVNIAMLALLERNHRGENVTPINFVLDEMKSIGRIEMLPSFLERARKYKGRYFIGLQSEGQMYELFGKENGRNLLDIIGNKFYFNIGGNDQTKAVSTEMGEGKVIEKRETTSFGSRKSQERNSLAENLSQEAAVTATDLSSQRDGLFYLKVLHHDPVKGCVRKVKYPQIQPTLKEIARYPRPTSEIKRLLAQESASENAPTMMQPSSENSSPEANTPATEATPKEQEDTLVSNKDEINAPAANDGKPVKADIKAEFEAQLKPKNSEASLDDHGAKPKKIQRNPIIF